jgi:hypothetical protein
VGADRGQPEPPSWPPPDDTSPDVRVPGREWYPGTQWYPGREYRPPRYGEGGYGETRYGETGYGETGYGETRYGETRYREPAHLPAGEHSSRDLEHREVVYRDEYRPPGRHSVPGRKPPRRRRPGRRHQIRNGMLIGLGCLVVIVAIGTGLTGEKFPTSSSQSHVSAGQSVATTPAAARPKARTKPRSARSGPRPILTYRVTGTPGARVTYGPAGTYLTGRAPLQVTARLGNPLYYFVTAELPGKGSVECEILIGTKVMAKSAAAGRRSLASCQISRDPLSGKWQDADGG